MQDHREELLTGEVVALVSSAVRAQEPWALVAAHLTGVTAHTESRLYESACSTLMQVADSDGMMMQMPATPMRCG